MTSGSENIRGRAQGPLHTTELVAARQAKRRYKAREWEPITYGSRVSPVLKWLFDEMNTQRVSIAELERRCEVSRRAMHHWKTGEISPTLENLEAAAAALGARIVIEALPRPDETERGSGMAAGHNPPGHALPDKPAPSPAPLPSLTPHATKDAPATPGQGGTP